MTTKQTKDEILSVRVSSRLRERLERAAQASEQHVGEYMRKAALKQVERDERSGRGE